MDDDFLNNGDYFNVEIISMWRLFQCGDYFNVEIISMWRLFQCGD
jgi:hypothetical protein